MMILDDVGTGEVQPRPVRLVQLHVSGGLVQLALLSDLHSYQPTVMIVDEDGTAEVRPRPLKPVQLHVSGGVVPWTVCRVT